MYQITKSYVQLESTRLPLRMVQYSTPENGQRRHYLKSGVSAERHSKDVKRLKKKDDWKESIPEP